jgi:RNA polymerase sigma factor for flagellar operon FliA
MAASLAEVELLKHYLETHSPAVREELVLRYVSLVHFVLGRLGISQELGNDYEDLVNQGLIGLIEAVDRYNPSFNTQFSTYATFRIRGKILDYLRSLDWLSRTARHRAREVRAAVTSLTEQTSRAPSDEELAAYMGIEVSKVQQALVDSSRVIVSLDAVIDIDEENESSLYDTLADENQQDPQDEFLDRDMKSRLVMAIKELPKRDQQVLSLYYYENLTLREIGEVLGVSESRACQLHARAVMSLQSLMTQGVAHA